jgi:hypothetical protein
MHFGLGFDIFVMQDPKKTLINLLKDELLIVDDGGQAIIGIVSGAWYDKDLFKDALGWQVSVGPNVDTDARILDLGAFHREYIGVYAVNIWVLQKRNVNYTPDRARWDLTQKIDDILFREIFDPSSDAKYEVLTGWSERDEPEDNLLRSEILVAVYYEKERPL